MHGLILAELKKYVETKLGKPAWPALLQEAGLPGKVYLIGSTYPDGEVVALVSAAERITKQPVAAILEDFGEFIVPDLVETYKPFIRPTWKALDLIEHTEATIHKAVRLRNPGADPPRLKATRTGPREVRLVYSSARKMCGVAKGIAVGIGKFYKEPVTYTETRCMLKGDDACHISFRT